LPPVEIKGDEAHIRPENRQSIQTPHFSRRKIAFLGALPLMQKFNALIEVEMKAIASASTGL